MDGSIPGFPILHQLLKLAQTQVHLVGDTIHTSHPSLPTSSPALSLSQHKGLFHWVGFSHQVAKLLGLQLQISPSSDYSELISLRIDRLDLAVQGTLKSLLQHHNSKASILWRLAFFVVQLSHLSMTTGKTIALMLWTSVGKVMFLL